MRERELILVLGKTGSGKTQWTKRYAANLTRYIALEYNAEYPGVVTRSLPELTTYLEKHGGTYFRLCHWTVEDFPAVCDCARIVGHLTLIIEEADRFWMDGEL